MRSAVLLLLLAILFPLSAASAQQRVASPLPASGTKVRILEEGEDPVTGHFWYSRADTLYFTEMARGDSSAFVTLAPGRRLEASRGRRRDFWSLMGATVGAVLGGTAARFAVADDPEDDTAQHVGRTVQGAVAGIVVGGLTGWVIAPERWRAVEVPPPSLDSVAATAPPSN